MNVGSKLTESRSEAMPSTDRSASSTASTPLTDNAKPTVTIMTDSRTVDADSPSTHLVGDLPIRDASSLPSDTLAGSTRFTPSKITVVDADQPLPQSPVPEIISPTSSLQHMLIGTPDEIVAAFALTQLSREAFHVYREEEVDAAKTLLSLRKCEERMESELKKKTK